jgi:hypothetical protein
MPIQNVRPTSDVIRIAERVPAACSGSAGNANEVKAITLIARVTGKLRPIVQRRPVVSEFGVHTMSADDWRLDRLIGRLPRRLRSTVRFLLLVLAAHHLRVDRVQPDDLLLQLLYGLSTQFPPMPNIDVLHCAQLV